MYYPHACTLVGFQSGGHIYTYQYTLSSSLPSSTPNVIHKYTTTGKLITRTRAHPLYGLVSTWKLVQFHAAPAALPPQQMHGPHHA